MKSNVAGRRAVGAHIIVTVSQNASQELLFRQSLQSGMCRAVGAHIIIMVPTSGTRKPAPTDARTSRMGRMKPLGAPFFSAMSENEYCAHACAVWNYI